MPVEVNTLIEENVNETNQDTSPEDESSDDINSVDEIKNGISTAINITSQHQSVPSSNLTKCTQCDLLFTQRHSMLKHVRYKHSDQNMQIFISFEVKIFPMCNRS